MFPLPEPAPRGLFPARLRVLVERVRLGVQHPILRALALAEDPGALSAGLAGWGAGAAAGRATPPPPPWRVKRRHAHVRRAPAERPPRRPVGA